ncbi:MAG: 50S ribosomal protein L4 [Candidatus Omnitrophica bacterium]|nr:50S ribosomal protein L4 [Candidatus Omnitrophota bacterium]
MATLPVLNKEGKEAGTIELPEGIFGGRVKQEVLHQAVVMYQASLRQGTASTKERADVSGGGKKPYRQKGTGRARAGSSRSPVWKGGGVVFGPHPRDFRYTIPKKIRRAALKESLNAKYQSRQMVCLDELKEEFAKTKEFVKVLEALKVQGKTLALLDGCDQSVLRVSRNLPRFQVVRSKDVNAYDILKNKTLLLTKSSFDKLVERIEK